MQVAMLPCTRKDHVSSLSMQSAKPGWLVKWPRHIFQDQVEIGCKVLTMGRNSVVNMRTPGLMVPVVYRSLHCVPQ